MILQPLQFVLAVWSGWLNEQQAHVVDHLREENRHSSNQVRGGTRGANGTRTNAEPEPASADYPPLERFSPAAPPACPPAHDHLVRRKQRLSEGPAVLALWRELAWRPE